MPRTENQKAVAAYLPLELYDKLEQFKLEEDLKSDSKTINIILERWFFGEVPIPAIAKTNRLEERLSEVEQTCASLQAQIVLLDALLRIKIDIDSEVPEIVPSEVPEIVPSEVPSTINSEVPEIVPSEVPSTINSEVPEIVPSTIDSDLESNLIITENIAVSLPENLSQALAESPVELNKIVICAIDKESGLFYYWNGSQKGFSNSMLLAKRYKSEGMAERARVGILKDDYYRDYYSGNFELRYNTVRYFREHPNFQPKGRELAKV